MALGNITDTTKELKTQVEHIVNDNLDYYKLRGLKVAAKSTTGLLKFFVVSLACLLIVFFLSLAGGFALAEHWNSNAYGFLAIAGIIFVLLLLFIALGKYIIDKPILRIFSKMLNDD